MKKCVFAALLALCVILTLLPAAALANAIEEYNTFAAGLHNPTENGTYSYIYFGMNGETPIKWRVLDSKNTNILEPDTNYNEHGMFLLSENFLGGPFSFRSYTDTPPTNANAYQASDLRTTLNGFGTTMFTEVEQSIIMAATKSDDDILNGDRLFLLSAQEAGNTEGGIAAAYFPKGEENLKVTTGEWWLRSPVSGNNVSTIKSDGTMGEAAPNVSLYLRPAVNIRSIDTVFFSDANNGKAGNGVSSTLAEVPASTPTEWKLTLQLPPDSRNNFAYEASGSTRIGNKLTIEYLNAPTGGNEYISAIIQETNKVPSRITHYGRILLPTSADGKATIILPDDMENKELLVFTEQCNGPKKTDYISSTLYPVDLNPPTSAIEANPTSLSFAPAYEVGARPAAQTVTLTNVGNQSVTIDLPTLDHYTVTAGAGFSGGHATLAGTGDTATFTVQPSPELSVGEYNGTIDIDIPDGVSASVSVSFTVKTPVAAILSGTGGFLSPSQYGGRSAYSHVYFGMDGANPIAWRVLDASKTNTGADGAFLLSEGVLPSGTCKFNDWSGSQPITYPSSNARQVLETNTDSVRKTFFSNLEQGAMLETTTTSDSLNADKLFLLSFDEAYTSAYFTVDSVTPRLASEDRVVKDGSDVPQWWWLRSIDGYPYVYGVNSDGAVCRGLYANMEFYLRPAFNLIPSSVLFTSAEGGKDASGMGGGLAAVGKNTADYWKLTLKDSGRDGFTIGSPTDNGGLLSIPYSGAATGANEFISAIVKDASGSITHYGRVARASSESGTAQIDLSDVTIAATDTLYVFSEQYNGEQKTDYASPLRAVVVPPPAYSLSATPETLAFGNSCAGYTRPDAREVTVTNTGNRSITVTLPTLDNYTIVAVTGFSDGSATLAAGGTATFTVQPNPGLHVGPYNGTITVSGSNGSNSASDTVSVAFAVVEPVNVTISGNGSPTEFSIIEGQSIELTANVTGGAEGASYGYAWIIPIPSAPPTWTQFNNPFATTKSVDVSPTADTTYKVGVRDVDNSNNNAIDQVLVTVEAATHGITVSPASLSFGSVYTGYTQPNPQTVTVTYTGNIGSVTLTQPTSADYEIGSLSRTTLDTTNATATFTVRPKARLGAGPYNGAITVSGSYGASGTVDDAVGVTFEVAVTTYSIAASANNAAYGSVTGGGTYDENAPVTLTAAANPSYHFVKWTENNADAGTANPLTFLATGPRTLTAVFGADANPPATENAILNISEGQSYTQGATVTFTAVGGGMDNAAPYPNDMRWLPTGWETNPSGTFNTGFTQSFPTAGMSLGGHTLTVTFTKQRYVGGAWSAISPAVIDTKSVGFLLAAPTALAVTVQPADQYVTEGQRATFSLSAAGDGLTYQWYENRNDGRGWERLNGATGPAYTIPAAGLNANGFRYTCRLMDAYGQTLDSGVATLYVASAVIPPQTGDPSALLLWFCLLGGTGLLVLMLFKRRRA